MGRVMAVTATATALRRSSIVPIGVSSLVLGGMLALPVIAVVHERLPSHPPVVASRLLAIAALAATSLLVARPIVSLLAVGTGLRRTVAVIVGAVVGALPVVTPLLELLRAPADPVAQLAWILGEEDNAQIVGIAREVIVMGPGGGDLAEQYGTGAVVLATTLMRILGYPDPALDPRFLAIHAFTLSTLLAAVVLATGIALIVLAGLPDARRAGPVETSLLAVVTAGATVVALGVAVGLPLRTGFLTFTWAIAWAVLAAATSALVARRRLPSGSTAGLAVTLLASVLMLISAWPFLLAAVVPGLGLLAASLPLSRWWRAVRGHPALSLIALVAIVAVAVGSVRGSAVAEVLSYGRDALTVDGSRIYFDRDLRDAMILTAVVSALVAMRRADRRILTAVGGPGLSVLVSWLMLHAAARLLTGGVLNYAGTKLLYGAVAVASATAVPVLLTSWAGRPLRRSVLPGLAAVAVGVLLWPSATVRTVEDWADRLAPSRPPHAIALVEAIDRTTLDLPVRCRPQPGTEATGTSRWAVYYCVRWVEDALNEDRQSAFRERFLLAPDGTFDPIVAEAAATGLYGFAYVMPAGPGWFGWDGRS
jgi:hypothetical protein